MANNVFANGREVSCKSGSGKSIASFPDVCMTPPENPATPPGVPVPYPNTGSAGDTSSGSRTVKISGKEVSLKNKSEFKSSMGDEAGCAAKKGVVTSKNRGKVFFKAWSMDVKIEGENAVRHLDIMTHNHASDPPNTPPWPFMDSATIPPIGPVNDPCWGEKIREEEACKGKDHAELCKNAGLGDSPQEAGMTSRSDARYGSVYSETDGVADSLPQSGDREVGQRDDNKAQVNAWNKSQANSCLAAKRCKLTPYKPKECCEGQTPHHLIDEKFAESVSGTSYDSDAAPCICAEGSGSTKGSHGTMHAHTKTYLLANGYHDDPKFKYKDLRAQAASSVDIVFRQSGCSQACIEAQIDHYHKDNGFSDDTKLTTNINSGRGPDQADAQVAWSKSRADALSG